MRSRPHVHVLAIGGTIAMTDEAGKGAIPTIDGDSLVRRVPGLQDAGDVTAETFLNSPGSHLRMEDIVRLAGRIQNLVDEGVDGVVVTQGTDTIEETAFALDLLGPDQIPVVITGAMRRPGQPGADGAANLSNAVQIAGSAEARAMGSLVTLDDTIHASRFVRKAHSSRPSAFTSSTAGPVGWVAEGRVRIALRPHRGPRLRPAEVGLPVPPVALVRLSLGDDGRLIPAIRDHGYKGAVVEALGVGHVGHWLVNSLAALADDVPVVFASRTGAGEVFEETYGFEGSEQHLIETGLIPAGILDGLKARILLSLALAAGWGRERLTQAIRDYMR